VQQRFPGLQAASRQVINGEDQQMQSQTDYLNNMILAAIAILAAITVVNTLVMTTLDRRQELELLRRIGATAGQLLTATAWQAALVAGAGIAAGLAAGGVTLCTMTRAITGTWPYIPVSAGLAVIGCALALTFAGTLGPTALLLRRVSASVAMMEHRSRQVHSVHRQPIGSLR
jgi:putative ABC transport system permease protein